MNIELTREQLDTVLVAMHCKVNDFIKADDTEQAKEYESIIQVIYDQYDDE